MKTKMTEIETFLRKKRVWTKFQKNYRAENRRESFEKYITRMGDNNPNAIASAFLWPDKEFDLWNKLDLEYDPNQA